MLLVACDRHFTTNDRIWKLETGFGIFNSLNRQICSNTNAALMTIASQDIEKIDANETIINITVETQHPTYDIMHDCHQVKRDTSKLVRTFSPRMYI